MTKEIYAAFDGITENFDSIGENTISDRIDIDIKKITDGVMSNIGKGGRKKNMGKRITISLIAAAVGIGIVGTTVFASLGGLDAAFSSVFAGDMNAANLYNGGNVLIDTDDENLNINLLGVTGDDKTAYAAIELTHNDGTAFTHNAESSVGLATTTEFYYYTENDDDENGYYTSDYKEDENAVSVYVDKTVWQRMTTNLSVGGGSYSYIGGWMPIYSSKNVQYGERYFTKTEVEDNGKKLLMYIKIINDTNTLKGNTLNVSFKSLSEYIPVKVLESYENVNDDFYTYDFYKYLSDNYFEKGIDVSIEENDKNGIDLVQTENRRIDVDFNLSVNLNYKSDTKTVNLDSETTKKFFTYEPADNAELSISAFGINIFSDTAYQNNDAVDTGKITVVMKDGTKYGLIPTVDKHTSDNIIVRTEYTTDFGTTIDDILNISYNAFENHKTHLININDVEKIIINDTEIDVK